MSGGLRHSLDAIFIWNCFEQLDDPSAALRAARSLLKPNGLLVIRVPNFGYYESFRNLTKPKPLRSRALGSLAYNNLLGFPYLAGYTPQLLNSLVGRHSFEPLAGFDSTLITTPFPDLTSKIRRELAIVNQPYRNAKVRNPFALSGPWIEVAYRRP